MSKKLSPAQKAARKAVKTRQARDTLYSTYGYETYEVLELMMKGKTNAEVERMTCIPMRSVASYAANLSRGTYNWVLARCNF